MKYSNSNNVISITHAIIITLIVILCSSCCLVLIPYIGYRAASFVLLIIVSIIAMFFDFGSVLLAAFLSALICGFFFIPPHSIFTVATTVDLLILSMYFIITMINGVLGLKIKKEENLKKIGYDKKLYNNVLDSISHEIKTPLSIIKGATELLTEDHMLSEETKKELLAEIKTASIRLWKYIDTTAQNIPIH